MTRPFVIVEHEQRSPEWFQSRLGRLTGSAAGDMLDVLKDGKSPGYKRRDLLARLVCERLTGMAQDDTYVNAVMQWGIDHESDALLDYEWRSGNLVRGTGFLSHTTLMVGCSLDGDVNDFKGIVELKCPKSSTHLSYWKAGGVPQTHMPQILHNLWISGAQWCDFVSFDPRFPESKQLFIARVPRVEIDVLAYGKAAQRFLDEIDAEIETLMGAGAVA
jgi:predicted phage-related endonuclease